MKTLMFLLSLFLSAHLTAQVLPKEFKSFAAVQIRSEPSSQSNFIFTLPKRKAFTLLEYAENGYWKIEYKGQSGYINETMLINYPELKPLIAEIKEKEAKQEELDEIAYKKAFAQKQKQEKEDHRKYCIERFGKEFGIYVANGTLKIGMTIEMVLESIGKPENINTSHYSWGKQEQWIYPRKYLYFENGKLTSWQSSTY